MTAQLALFPNRAEPYYGGRGRRPRALAAVLAIVRARGRETVGELAIARSRRVGTVRGQVAHLVRQGLVVRVGRGVVAAVGEETCRG